MPAFVKVGRDIILGRGLRAKHWGGPVIFGAQAIYACPKTNHAAVVEVQACPSSIAGAMFSSLSSIEAAADEAANTGFNWRAHVVTLRDLPREITSSPNWPVNGAHRPIIVLKREHVTGINRKGPTLLVECGEEQFAFRLKLFGRGKALENLRALGWAI
jgi:hypothetical protein